MIPILDKLKYFLDGLKLKRNALSIIKQLWPQYLHDSIRNGTIFKILTPICTLQHLWPQYFQKLLSKGVQGPVIFIPAIDLAITIEMCKDLAGFDKVFIRMKQDEQAAFSEMTFAASLLKLGHTPLLEPELNGKVLDTLVNINGREIYCEVVSPDLSDPMKESYKNMGQLSQQLMKENPNTDINIFLLSEPDHSIVAQLLSYIKNLSLYDETRTYELQNLAYIRYGPFHSVIPPFKPARNELNLPTINLASCMTGRKNARVNVSLAVTDNRVQRLISNETKHFSKDKTNLLVMDITRIPGGLRSWEPLVQRRFQPNMNRRIGAIVLLKQYNYINKTIHKWKAMHNQYAYYPFPEVLLEQLESLNNSQN